MNPTSNRTVRLKWCYLPLFVFFHSFGFGESNSTQIEPSPLMKHEAKWLVQALEQAHFSKVSIQKLDSGEFLRSYLKKLDISCLLTSEILTIQKP